MLQRDANMLEVSCSVIPACSESKSWRVITLQMKGRWESNIKAWFPFKYSQKLNCAASFFPKHNYNFQDRSVYFPPAKYVDRSWEYTTRSQTRECGTWDCGRAIPRKGIHTVNGISLALHVLQRLSEQQSYPVIQCVSEMSVIQPFSILRTHTFMQ